MTEVSNPIYELTQMTGRLKNVERRTVILSFEVNRHYWTVFLLSTAGGLGISAVFIPLFGFYAFILAAVLMPIGIFLFYSRQSRGLQLRQYKALLNKWRNVNGIFLINGAPFADPMFIMHEPVTVQSKPSREFTFASPFENQPIKPAIGTRQGN
ncbi:hypothetical protein [Lysinibacter cavernae]|uniref:hypothetical protein n=1 Tax=Lysinibacter cavernae TaxID=1640652 RepID=UPI00361D05A8